MLYVQRKSLAKVPNPPRNGLLSVPNNRKEGYADYKPGMCYISVFDLRTAESGGTTQSSDPDATDEAYIGNIPNQDSTKKYKSTPQRFHNTRSRKHFRKNWGRESLLKNAIANCTDWSKRKSEQKLVTVHDEEKILSSFRVK